MTEDPSSLSELRRGTQMTEGFECGSGNAEVGKKTKSEFGMWKSEYGEKAEMDVDV